MLLKAQSVQSIGDLVLIRIYNPSNDDVEDNGRIHDAADSKSELEHDGVTSIERTPFHEVSSWTMTVARLLQEQWPRQDQDKQQNTESHADHGDANESTKPGHNAREGEHADSFLAADDDAYYRKFIVHHEKTCPRYSLACSYILLQQSPQRPINTFVVGHGRLTECYESAGGNAVAATYILIDPKHQGKGYGRTLIYLMEQEAKAKERLGCDYHFVYLWCKATTAPFYEKSDYLPCKNRVSLQRPCLKALTASSVQSLEDILLRRRRPRGEDNNQKDSSSAAMTNDNNKTVGKATKKLETIILLPSQSKSDNTKNDTEQPTVEDDVWLRKRLVDHVESIIVSEQDRMIELQQFIASTNIATIVSNNLSTNTIVVAEQSDSNSWYQYRWNPHVPWQMQIGPTCGLTAIRMIRDYYSASNPSKEEGTQKKSPPSSSSLLTDARKRGYTDDGEMFDVDQLRDLMKDRLLMTNTGSLSPKDSAASNKSMDTFTVKTRDASSLTTEEIDSTIQKGGFWILPYDSNPRTKLPGNFRGKHAHWGIVVGILYSRTTEPKRCASTTNTANDGSLIVKQGISEEDSKVFGNADLASIDCSAHLMVQHSLSSKWAIAPMENWFDSNRQLLSVNEDKFALGNEERLNLNNKVILVMPT